MTPKKNPIELRPCRWWGKLPWSAVLLCLIVWPMQGESGPAIDHRVGATTASVSPSRPGAGFVVNLDATGKPVQAVPADIAKRRSSASQTGLVVEKSSLPGGGIAVDLKGRFQQAVTATIGPDGAPRISCVPADSLTTCPHGKE